MVKTSLDKVSFGNCIAVMFQVFTWVRCRHENFAMNLHGRDDGRYRLWNVFEKGEENEDANERFFVRKSAK